MIVQGAGEALAEKDRMIDGAWMHSCQRHTILRHTEYKALSGRVRRTNGPPCLTIREKSADHHEGRIRPLYALYGFVRFIADLPAGPALDRLAVIRFGQSIGGIRLNLIVSRHGEQSLL